MPCTKTTVTFPILGVFNFTKTYLRLCKPIHWRTAIRNKVQRISYVRCEELAAPHWQSKGSPSNLCCIWPASQNIWREGWFVLSLRENLPFPPSYFWRQHIKVSSPEMPSTSPALLSLKRMTVFCDFEGNRTIMSTLKSYCSENSILLSALFQKWHLISNRSFQAEIFKLKFSTRNMK